MVRFRGFAQLTWSIHTPFRLPAMRYILYLLRNDRTHRNQMIRQRREEIMLHRRTFEVLALAIVLMATVGAAEAQDKKYPN